MEQNTINYPAFFEAAKQALRDRDELKLQEENLRDACESIEKDLEAENKQKNDAIALTIKKRQSEVTKTYDSEIEAGEAKLKKAGARREKAKSIGVKERITQETAALNAENRELAENIKTLFKNNNVPGICNTNLYYTIFFPHRFFDFVKLIILFALIFALLPYGIYYFMPYKKPIYLIIIYVAIVLIFGGLYIAIGNATKLKHLDILLNGRRIRDEIDLNKKRIKTITKNILRDKNESRYNLAEFDDEISHINQELADTTMKKKEALQNFENVTKNIITDEITENARPRLEELIKRLSETKAKLRDTESKRKSKVLEITDNYEMYLGKEFLNEEGIDALAEIMAHGTATNISEAIDEYHKREEE